MKPNLDNQPDFLHKSFSGNGMILTLEVEDAKKEFKRVKNTPINFLLEYKEEPWGQKHFMINDPSGLILDVVEITNPKDYLR